jgi:hypothetical protein
MTIEQTVEIPASRRVTFDLPFSVPIGTAKAELTLTPELAAAPVPVERDVQKYPWEEAIGMFRDAKFSSEKLFDERARDLLREEAKLFGKISPEAREKAARRGITPEALGLGEFV